MSFEMLFFYNKYYLLYKFFQYHSFSQKCHRASFFVCQKTLKLYFQVIVCHQVNNGRGQGIRTLGGFHLAGFQNRYNRPTLSTLYTYNMVRMVRIELTLRNRNGILSPARLPIPPHSHMCILRLQKKWWFETESNCRHKDFQSFALPTELSSHYFF